MVPAEFGSQDHGKIEHRLGRLRADVAMHDRLYYRENNPQISDFEYDCLKAELLRLEQVGANFGIKSEEDAIGNDLSGGFRKARHLSPMQSLSNTYSRDELFAFDARVKKQLSGENYTYVIEPKIDGIAINLIYENGHLVTALTRGDGTTGDDVTGNISALESLPNILVGCPASIEVRGEVFIDWATFELANEHRRSNGLVEYANPRNLAAGTLKSLDAADAKARHLQLIAYAIGYSSDSSLKTQDDVLKRLAEWGFNTHDKYWTAANIGEAWECVGELDLARRHFRYWTDGAVLKVSELGLHEILGSTAKSPRWAIAYKFAPARVSTRLKNIVLQVGRTGIVTPVAELEAVDVAGSTVSRATLHNADEIEKKDIRINDYVFLEKAGEIIPAIVSVDPTRRTENCQPFVFPSNCPSCGCRLIRREGEVAWRCVNPECGAQLRCKIMYFVSKSAMGIDNLGEAIVEQLVNSGRLRTIADVYDLTYNDLVALPKLGQKSALGILKNIDSSKTQSLWRFINGLGIAGVGEQTAKDLAQKFGSIGELSTASAEELAQISGIGEKTVRSIVEFFSDANNQNILESFRRHGVPAVKMPPKSGGTAAPFSGKTFALTGVLKEFTRAQLVNIIENHGGRISDSISRKTNVVICGSSAGLKLEKARELGIEIWNEAALMANCKLCGIGT